MTLRRKKKKKFANNTADINTPDDLVLPKRKLRKRYRKQKCAFVYADQTKCKRNAVGKSTLCKKHGGNSVIEEELIKTAELVVSDSMAIAGTKFKPHVHPLLFIDLSRQGLSEVEIASAFTVGIKTLKVWAERYAEFSTAYEIGQALHETWWLQQGKGGLQNVRNFNTSLFKFLTGNKLGWADKVETKNLNMNTHGVLLVPSRVSEAQWAEDNAEEDIRNITPTEKKNE